MGYLLEAFKVIGQFSAVTGGVYLGWNLNNKSQGRTRLTSARADWAAAAEMCLGVIVPSLRGVQTMRDDPGHAQDVADLLRREHALEDARAELRAATVRLLLIDPRSPHASTIRVLEEGIVAASLPPGRPHEVRNRVDEARKKLRGLVELWETAT